MNLEATVTKIESELGRLRKAVKKLKTTVSEYPQPIIQAAPVVETQVDLRPMMETMQADVEDMLGRSERKIFKELSAMESRLETSLKDALKEAKASAASSAEVLLQAAAASAASKTRWTAPRAKSPCSSSLVDLTSRQPYRTREKRERESQTPTQKEKTFAEVATFRKNLMHKMLKMTTK